MIESEEALIRRCRQGDREAFGVLVKKHAGRAIRGAYMLLGNHEDALDASQEAFARAWRHIRRFRGQAKFYTWYSALMRNVCLSRLRRRRRHRTAELVEEPVGPRGEWDPSLLAERNERAERLWRAIGQLPVNHREIIDLSHFQHLSYKEIAETLAIPIGTVMSRLHHARKTLREVLGRDGEEDGP
jgi:RNA polymerase sigma-70 factor (ECF subfamily)